MNAGKGRLHALDGGRQETALISGNQRTIQLQTVRQVDIMSAQKNRNKCFIRDIKDLHGIINHCGVLVNGASVK